MTRSRSDFGKSGGHKTGAKATFGPLADEMRVVVFDDVLFARPPDLGDLGRVEFVYYEHADDAVTVVALELRTLDRETASTHYAEHTGKPFFDGVVDFITSGPLVALVAEGPRAIEAFRGLAGATDPVKANPGTIRGDHALEIGENIVHGSD